jgi:predicted dinucleotide-binding enzyme
MQIFEVTTQTGDVVMVALKIKRAKQTSFDVVALAGGKVVVAVMRGDTRNGLPAGKVAPGNGELATKAFHEIFPGVAIRSCSYVREV